MKLQRLLGITMLLLSRKRLGAQELAERFEVSLRTIYRDIEAINAAGIPIASYAGADGGYEIMDDFRIERQIVTLDDLSSIVTALKGMQSTLQDGQIDHLLAKISALIAKNEQQRMEEAGEQLIIGLSPWTRVEADKDKLAELRLAAKNRNAVWLTYSNSEGETGERTVEPIGLAWKGSAWYLYAYCRLRKDCRTFKLSRIHKLRVDMEIFPRRKERLEDLDARWGQRDIQSYITMVLRFHPRVRVRVEEFFGPEQMTVEEDGSLLVRSEFPEDNWLYGMLLSYGPDLCVLAPKSLADEISGQARRIVELYK
ncbi:YafY family protein [Paenibacillus sp. NEAU-GSW1]|uniref:helix-turn-helix transcriptional regulator n=1 Tax=Paenibacillus sp. NEAU-GSW1 TaxID=2682486 RepID=UPI0012E3073C|nr:YafY family protein [Paenibacillus sp. NEAU-GSW1]MUT65797.1 WYL domain-containing protein [Paenibacillus sp. NEAU-GSW1]